MKNKKRYKENAGITLIALIVMIIVLLILAGISITVLTGENGILNKAGEAKKSTEYSQVKEEVLEKWYQVEKNAIHKNYSYDERLSEFTQMLINEDNTAVVTPGDKTIKVKYKEQEISIPKT